MTRKSGRPSEVRDIFKVSESDVLREMGDEEQEAAPRAPGQASQALGGAIHRPNEPEHKEEELKDLERPRSTVRHREHSARQRSSQVGRDNRPTPESGPRSRRLPSQRARGSSSKELEDAMEHRLEDKEKYGRNELQNAASDPYAAREDKEREEARFSGPDGHQGK